MRGLQRSQAPCGKSSRTHTVPRLAIRPAVHLESRYIPMGGDAGCLPPEAAGWPGSCPAPGSGPMTCNRRPRGLTGRVEFRGLKRHAGNLVGRTLYHAWRYGLLYTSNYSEYIRVWGQRSVILSNLPREATGRSGPCPVSSYEPHSCDHRPARGPSGIVGCYLWQACLGRGRPGSSTQS